MDGWAQSLRELGHWLFFGTIELQPWVLCVIVIVAFWMAIARAE